MAPPRDHAAQVDGSHLVQTIDRYHLVARIGRGGMAEVYRAKLASIGGYERDVALKVLLPNFAAEPEFVEMLLDEARIAGSIDHPNVLQVLDVGRTGGIFYLVMEYVDGKDLRSIAKQVLGGRLPVGMSLYVIYEMLRGLQAVHASVDERGVPRNIVHRDISPGNVLVDRRGFVKLGDFGIARASGRITRTRVGAVKGKSRYMAPEQLGPTTDHRADLYAAGVTLFEALFGDFARGSSAPSIYGPMFVWPERLPQGVVPPDVEAILRRAITQSPNDRYGSAGEMRADLEVAMRRIAPGYGPDLLARELRGLLTGSTKSEPIAVGARPRTATPEPGIALRPVRWRGAATAQNSLPELELNAHSGTELQLGAIEPMSSESTPTLSSLPTGSAPPPIPLGARRGVAAEIHSLPSELLSSDSPVQRVLRAIDERVRGLFAKTLGRRRGTGLLVACLALLTIGIAVAIAASGGKETVDVPRAEAVAPRQPEQPRTVPLPANGTVEVAGPAGAVVQVDGDLYPSAPTKIELPPGDYTVRVYAGPQHATTSRVHVVAGHLTSL